MMKDYIKPEIKIAKFDTVVGTLMNLSDLNATQQIQDFSSNYEANQKVQNSRDFNKAIQLN